MRHILAHDYATVDLEEVYDVVTAHLPDMLVLLRALICAREQDVGWKYDS